MKNFRVVIMRSRMREHERFMVSGRRKKESSNTQKELEEDEIFNFARKSYKYVNHDLFPIVLCVAFTYLYVFVMWRNEFIQIYTYFR